jgi:FAD:protein FMN transferase
MSPTDTPKLSRPLPRRRFLAIAAAACGLPVLPARTRGAAATLRVWQGAALGADATLQINHPDPAAADRLILACLAEVRRLEMAMSLYDSNSALVRLNRAGELADPPLDLVRVLSESAHFHARTNGAFDVTVQPLWALYAAHFSQSDPDPAGPKPEAIESVLARVGEPWLEVTASRIRFLRPGMGATLNGIGQGYITDRIVELLRANGIDQALVDMGETRAIGGHPAGGPWRVGLEVPRAPGQIAERVELADRAVATSGGYGTEFDAAGRFNHIIDPEGGGTSWRYAAVSVIAPTATEADALSVAFDLMPPERIEPLVRSRGLQAHLAFADGRWLILG